MARRGRCRDAAAGRSPGVPVTSAVWKDEEGREAMRHGRAQAWPRWCRSGARMPGPRWRASGTTSHEAGECPGHGRSATTGRGAGRPLGWRPGRPRPIASARSGRCDPRNAGIVDRPGDRSEGGRMAVRCDVPAAKPRRRSGRTATWQVDRHGGLSCPLRITMAERTAVPTGAASRRPVAPDAVRGFRRSRLVVSRFAVGRDDRHARGCLQPLRVERTRCRS